MMGLLYCMACLLVCNNGVIALYVCGRECTFGVCVCECVVVLVMSGMASLDAIVPDHFSFCILLFFLYWSKAMMS